MGNFFCPLFLFSLVALKLFIRVLTFYFSVEMNLKHFVSRQTINNLSKLNGRSLSPRLDSHINLSTITTPLLRSSSSPKVDYFTLHQNPKTPKPIVSFKRYIHSTQETKQIVSSIDPKTDSQEEEDGDMNEFLSRFVWIMREKISETYPDADKQTIDGMLLIIVEKVVSEMEKGGIERMLGSVEASPSQDFSDDLWKTVWEVSNSVLEDMEKLRKKEKMKGFLQSEEVKEMCRFAGEIGIRGDMLRELRFKWAREKMEECDFYVSLERLRAEAQAQEKGEAAEGKDAEEGVGVEEKPKVVTLPKRHGKIRYRIYGLDLSDPKWTAVADKIHERGEIIWPEEPKPISGKCKLVTDKIVSLKETEDPSPLLAEWKELLQPSRIDWINLLDRLQEQNTQMYFKVYWFQKFLHPILLLHFAIFMINILLFNMVEYRNV